MAVDERGRHELFVRLEEVLESEEAETLMSKLPIRGLDERATKGDLETMEHRLTATFRGELNAAITSQTRAIVFALVASNATVAAMAFGATLVG